MVAIDVGIDGFGNAEWNSGSVLVGRGIREAFTISVFLQTLFLSQISSISRMLLLLLHQ